MTDQPSTQEGWALEAVREFGPTDAPSLVEHMQQNHTITEEAAGDAIWNLIDGHRLLVDDDCRLVLP